ncbi:MAG: TetR family transcriptional regulator [Hydrogenophilales bacterium 17-61-9]|nr:MAG: TetR family transcriptional regulator [Hydrogenophilales bacterium 17-61-9]
MAERGRPRSFDRAAALRRAMEVFWAQGYDGTSMTDLIAAMAVNSPSIYAAFGSKEALFREAVALYRATEGGRIWGAMTTAPSARAAIETVLRASAEEFTRPSKPRGCLIVLGALNADDGSEAVHRELQEHRAENMKMLLLRLKRGVAEGELPDGPDWRAIAAFYITVQQGMSIQARDGASRKALLAVADCAMAAWDGLVSCDRDEGSL